jgi:hypothetical protein
LRSFFTQEEQGNEMLLELVFKWVEFKRIWDIIKGINVYVIDKLIRIRISLMIMRWSRHPDKHPDEMDKKMNNNKRKTLRIEYWK